MKHQDAMLGALSAALLATVPSPATAQETGQQQNAQSLQQELARRDAIIADLLARVEQLELALGMRLGAASQAANAPQVPAANTGPVIASSTPETAASYTGADADRALERTLVQAGALLLPSGTIEITPQFGFVRQVISAPTFIFEEDATLVGIVEQRRNRYVAGLSLRMGLPIDSQIEIDVPYQFVDRSLVTKVGFGPIGATSQSRSAFGDVSVALAHTLLRERGWLPDLVGRLRWNTGSGKFEDDGVALGGGFASLGGSLTAIKRQDPLVFVGSVSYDSFFAEQAIDPGHVVGVSLGTLLAASPETSLRFTFDQQFHSQFRLGGIPIDGSSRTVAFLTTGASSLLHRGVLLDIAARFGLTDDSPDYSLVISLPVRF